MTTTSSFSASASTSASSAPSTPPQPPEVPGHDPQPDTDTTTAASTKRILVISAHPDDPDFGAGGTVAKWTSGGHEAHYLIVTDGSKGSGDRDMTSERLVALRQEEQRAAARQVGVSEVHFLGFPDGEVMPDLRLRHALTRELRRLRPDIVVTHDPATIYWDQYINHPDHRAVGQAALDAIFPTARDHLNVPEHLAEGLEPHIVTEVYLTGSQKPDTFFDISSTLEQKLAALREHVSQFKDVEGVLGRVRERAGLAAQMAADQGQPGLTLAEGFKKIELS